MRERITVDAYFHLGKPCLAGTRTPVQSVRALVQEGVFREIIQGYYPGLGLEDIRALTPYATDIVTVKDIQIALSSRIWVQEPSTLASCP